MQWTSRRRWLFVALVSLTAVCTSLVVWNRSDTTRNYTPSATVSENAVRKALESWKAGSPAGPLPDTKPVIHVTDGGRKPEQTLESFTILGETRGTAGRSYAVTLNLHNPPEVVKTKYLVVGIDPLWVFRQEDYELLMHWDHHMPKTEATNDENQESLK